jgi:hypothetical protein
MLDAASGRDFSWVSGWPDARVLLAQKPTIPAFAGTGAGLGSCYGPENPAKNPAVPTHSSNISAAIPAHSRIANRLQRAVFTV